ncbi:MAG: hypothetical protein IKF52_04960 [Clostridia bacterium]|nr:hypothetical protein [Clostridia bacterium]
MKKTSKYRALKIAAVVCFVFAIFEFALAAIVIATPVSDEYVKSFSESENKDLADNEELSEEDVLLEDKIGFGVFFCIEATGFIIEGFLIFRAIKKGKTTLILIIILMSMFGQVTALISVAIHDSYDFNSASDLISLIINTVILKQIFEIRRLNSK